MDVQIIPLSRQLLLTYLDELLLIDQDTIGERMEQFESANIGVIWQDFDPNQVEYPQVGSTFVPGLSIIIDCLFNVGPEQARELAKQAWTPQL